MRRTHGFERSPLRVTRGHPVPVRRQIAAGLASEILDGHLPPGEPLPSTRELARRLGVHRNTVATAYRSLGERGLVSVVPGSPPRVSLSRLTAGQRGANRLLRQLVTRDPSSVALLRELANAAWESGVRRADLIAHLDEWRNDGNPPRLLLIEPDPGLRAALGAELRARACPRLVVSGWRAIGARSEVQPEVRADVRPASRSLIRSGTIVVARPRIALRAAAKLPGASEIFTLALVGGSAALALAMQIRLPGVVAVLTRSRQIRRFARHLAACHHAAGLSVAVPDPADPAALCRATRIARLILADASCRSLSLETRAPVRELHVVSDETVRKLRRYVGGQMSEAR